MLRGASAAQAVPYTPDALADLPVVAVPDLTATSSTAPAPDVTSAVALDVEDASCLRPVAAEEVAAHVAPVLDSTNGAESVSGGPLRFEQVYADQMAALREQAHREGFEAGHAEGMLAAEQAIAEMVETAQAQVAYEQDQWRVQAQSTLAALAAAVEALDARTAPAMTEMTESLSQAAFTLVEDLLGRELAAVSHPAREAVQRALRLVPADEAVVIRLHPSDHAALDADWLAALRPGVSVLADSNIEPSGAVAEAGARRVDAQLSTALGRVREVLTA